MCCVCLVLGDPRGMHHSSRPLRARHHPGMSQLMAPVSFTSAFNSGARLPLGDDETVEVRTHVVGELKVPSGRIYVGDPLTISFKQGEGALTRQMPKGVFPVEVVLARLEEGGDERVACARVRCGPPGARAVKWEPAAFNGRLPPGKDELPTYGVDSGMGCFFDGAARPHVGRETSVGWEEDLGKNEVISWTWHVADLGEANIVMFSAGKGDGAYGSYWGFDAEGRVVELVTDFNLLPLGGEQR